MLYGQVGETIVNLGQLNHICLIKWDMWTFMHPWITTLVDLLNVCWSAIWLLKLCSLKNDVLCTPCKLNFEG
jgi:hypothetical protein